MRACLKNWKWMARRDFGLGPASRWPPRFHAVSRPFTPFQPSKRKKYYKQAVWPNIKIRIFAGNTHPEIYFGF
jgi:hypothetical protein